MTVTHERKKISAKSSEYLLYQVGRVREVIGMEKRKRVS